VVLPVVKPAITLIEDGTDIVRVTWRRRARRQGALELAEKLQDSAAAYLIEHALDEARSKAVSIR
jgi:hypothetical protein